MTRLGFFGPAGTFTEAALRTVPQAEGAELVPLATVPATLDAVRTGEVEAGFVPLENSVEGSVSATLDELAAGQPLVVTREVLLPVRFVLAARPGTRLEDVRTIGTHGHAEAQTRRTVAALVPGAAVVAAFSTAGAAAAVSAGEAGLDAAICARVAAERYGLDVLAEDIGDNSAAVTRFVLVALPSSPAAPTGHDKTSLVAFIHDDHPGALLEILEEFAVRGVNLTRIESRPTGAGIGAYCFSLDAEGHVTEARVGEALMGLRRVCDDVRYLGSYERADAVPPTVRRGTADDDFAEARAWLARVREGTAT